MSCNFFGFSMTENYDDRKVDRYETDDLTISTAECYDGDLRFETAVRSPEYHDNRWVIVEAYTTKEKAQEGHNKWVKTMLENPPDVLQDCQNADISKFLSAEELRFERVIKNE